VNRAGRARLAAAALLALSGAASVQAAVPAPGRYEARLCVTPADADAPSCGAAQALWSGRRLLLQLSDIEYRLTLQAAQLERGRLDMQLMHGTMQIDEFRADYEWATSGLQFEDASKRTRYEVQFGARRRAHRSEVK
jgi:hypothetical protein